MHVGCDRDTVLGPILDGVAIRYRLPVLDDVVFSSDVGLGLEPRVLVNITGVFT